MDWLEIAVAADDEAVEAVAEVLRAHGRGVAIDEPFVQRNLEEAPERDTSRRPIVKTYLPNDEAAIEAQRRIAEALWHLGQLRAVEPLETRRIAEEDWANAWKAFFPILRVGERTVIVPPWRRYRRAASATSVRPSGRMQRLKDVIVRLDPGLAFGTGTHPTTRLCLRALERLVAPGARVLDVGTGSGILAIAAARLGAARVVALDIDPVAVGAARANVRRNRIARIVDVREGGPDTAFRAPRSGLGVARSQQPELETPDFDLLLANITARTNAALASHLATLLAPDGRLVASGILAESAHLVIEAFAAVGLEILSQEEEGDWVALIAARKRTSPCRPS